MLDSAEHEIYSAHKCLNANNFFIVGILTFISRINKASDNFKARTILIFQHFSCRAVEFPYSVEFSITSWLGHIFDML